MTQRNEHDAYYTPPALTRALLDRMEDDWISWHRNIETVEGEFIRKRLIAEPCAGDLWIDRELRRQSYLTVTGDIDDGCPVHYRGCDFFSQRADVYADADAIITNPPFSHGPRFVRRALELTGQVACLLRLSFLEPCESRESSARADLLKKLDRVVVLPRVSFYRGDVGTDSVTCAWFVWDNDSTRNRSADLEIVTEKELAEHAGQKTLFKDAQ